MELSKKTTILMSPELHALLVKTSEQTGRSIGELVRSACEKYYGQAARAERLKALEALYQMNLPVSDVETMKRESIEPYKPLPGWRPPDGEIE